MRDLLDQPLNIRGLTFDHLDVSLRRHLGLLRAPITQRYLLAVFAVLVAADPSGLQGRIPWAIYLGAWPLAMALFLLLQAGLLLALAALRRVARRPPAYWPAVSFLALAPTVVVMDETLERLAPVGHEPLLSERFVVLGVTIVMFEAIYMRYVKPRIPARAELSAAETRPETGARAGTQTPPDAAQAPDPAPAAATEDEAEAREDARTLLVGAQPVPLNEIRAIEAREHHVHVRLGDKTLTQRARLGDVLAQTRAEDGVQPHRSWWVARTARPRLVREGSRLLLRLADDSDVPVARGRQAEVEDWLRTHIG
ncbi:LytTR family DNA-binding domain-containing protein [Salipiger mucosus]|uniref:LytTR family DNA-binding domain-containing protein n=1 Tax=Salipiger mucosus TaxID=263378 RepID=UPI0018DB5261|nr:LytTR family DNA-binding domain-containing protein [Salipiger mucosus]